MISGAVNTDLEATIRLRLQGPSGNEREIDATIDTGFNGFLTLPPDLVRELSLRRIARGRAIVANGGEEIFDICSVVVFWDEDLRKVETTCLNNAPLVGMGLLYGHDLLIHVEEGGGVFIEPRDRGEAH